MLSTQQLVDKMNQAAKLIAEVVASSNITCGEVCESEGETIDYSTYGISDETSLMYMEGLATRVTAHVKVIQPTLINSTTPTPTRVQLDMFDNMMCDMNVRELRSSVHDNFESGVEWIDIVTLINDSNIEMSTDQADAFVCVMHSICHV